MAIIKGITVILKELREIGTDPFGAPLYEPEEVPVENVLVSPASSTDITDAMSMYGKKAVYTLGIPKGDAHDWEDTEVSFFGQTFRTFGFVTEGIEENIPLEWNRKIMVERYG